MKKTKTPKPKRPPISFYPTLEAETALEELKKQHPLASRSKIISAAIVEFDRNNRLVYKEGEDK